MQIYIKLNWKTEIVYSGKYNTDPYRDDIVGPETKTKGMHLLDNI